MNDIIFARALHVLGVVIWIGGVSMATTIVLPAIRRGDLGPDWLQAFHAIERRFSRQARIAALVVGASGLYMLVRLDLWDRFASARFWWMHAMVSLWLVFAFVLFVGEPLIVARRFKSWAAATPRHAFKWMYWGHMILLAISLIVIFGAVAGSQGWALFG